MLNTVWTECSNSSVWSEFSEQLLLFKLNFVITLSTVWSELSVNVKHCLDFILC